MGVDDQKDRTVFRPCQRVVDPDYSLASVARNKARSFYERVHCMRDVGLSPVTFEVVCGATSRSVI